MNYLITKNMVKDMILGRKRSITGRSNDFKAAYYVVLAVIVKQRWADGSYLCINTSRRIVLGNMDHMFGT